jgi:DNA-binding NarL/FixJ family response regulator
MILTLQPDFAILNFGMPKLNGLEVLCRLREVRSTTRVVLLSMSRDPATIGEAFRSGADGYVLKDEPSQDIFDAIDYIREGGRQYLTPVLRSEFVDGKEAQWASLSKRELEIFSLLVEGVRPRDIAKSLQISPKTVDTHRSHVMRKLEIGSVVGLVRFAIQHNLTPVAP